jgi:TetR/AcrR family transcriptional repressor of bet genes
VQATLTAIHRHGFAEATVSRIASLAGVSAGNIHHYFGGKDGLLEEAMRALLGDVREMTAERLAAANSPEERLRAIIESNFDPAVFTPEACTAWLHFLAQATHAERLSRLAKVSSRRLQSNLSATLKTLVEAERARSIADSVVAIIDGLWLHRAQTAERVAPDMARDAVLDYVHARIGSEARIIAERAPVHPTGRR